MAPGSDPPGVAGWGTVSPILTTMIVQAPAAAVRRATAQTELYSRTACALGLRLDVAGEAVDVRRGLRVGDLLRVRPAGRLDGLLPGAARPRAGYLRVRSTGPTPALEVALGPFAGWTVHFSLDELPPADPLADAAGTSVRPTTIRTSTVATSAVPISAVQNSAVPNSGPEMTDRTALTVHVQGPGAWRSARRTRRVRRAAGLLLGIATLLAREPLVVVAAVVLDGGGRVLAARRAEPSAHAGGWEFPGGKVEPGEREADALVRELAEELGVVVEVGERVGPDVDLGGPSVLRCRAAAITSGTPGPTPGQHDRIRWLTPDELEDVAWLPADRDVLPAVRALLLGPGRDRTGPK